jgi:choice-of-anchor B domain-containing protein
MAGGVAQAQSSSADVASDQAGFGRAVAVGGDHVFVGAPQDVNAPGRVYVYARDGEGAWREQALLEAKDGRVEDGFGAAIDATDETLVVGAPAANAVYVFRAGADGWSQAARLTPSDSTAAFGVSLALAGDRLFVGTDATVHLFRRADDGTWSESNVLRGKRMDADARFGRTLAASGEHLLVGAPQQGGGTVVAFRRGADGWREVQTLAPGLSGNAQFGAALAWADDQLLVGAPRAFDATGAVHTYTYDATNAEWVNGGQLRPRQGNPRDFFGAALTSDGTNLWIGAPGPVRMVFMLQNRTRRAWPRGTSATNPGGVLYRFERSDSTWAGATRIAHPGTEPGDGLGAALAANESVVAAGLPGDDYGAGTMGVFSIDDGDWTSDTPTSPAQGARFSDMTGEEQACTDGTVGPFSCEGVDMKSFLSIASIGGERGVHLTDVWGWTDPETGTEYSLVGRSDGVAFVDVSAPTHPTYIGDLPQTEKARVNSWGDVKVVGHYALTAADNAGDHGIQIFDLRKLRDVDPDEQPVTFEQDAHYDKVNSVHNIFVNKETDYAYLVGSSGGGTTCGGGLHMVNLEDPLNPTFAGCFSDPSTGRSGTGATHDVQCVVYRGPDADYKGREICIGSNETAISIADVTNKETPVAVSTGTYPDHAYVHQGWFGPEQRYFYQNDELDEVQGKVDHTRTLVWDLKDLDNPTLVNEVLLPPTSTDHNLYVEGGLMYQSNYTSGVRVLEMSDPTAPEEVAHFDTKPYGADDPGFAGSWSNYPYFESGIVVVSSIDEGLFVLEKPKQGL